MDSLLTSPAIKKTYTAQRLTLELGTYSYSQEFIIFFYRKNFTDTRKSYKKHHMWKTCLQIHAISLQVSRVERKTEVSQMVIFPQT